MNKIKPLFENFKKHLFPPYHKKDIPTMVVTIIVLLVLIITPLVVSQKSSLFSHAATADTVSPATGTLTAGATVITDSNVSGGQYVRLGSYSSGLAPTTGPTGTGGLTPNFYGINWHAIWIQPTTQDTEMGIFAQLGIKSVRLDVPWYQVEKTKGTYNSTYLSRLDNAIYGLVSRGIDPLVIVTSAPTWATGAPSGDPSPNTEPPLRTVIGSTCDPTVTNCTPYNSVSSYDNFLSFLINRWKGKVHEYEIWNEPTGGWAWKSTISNGTTAEQDDAADYTTLLKSAYTTAKAIDPTITILAGSLSGTDGNNQTFLKAMYANGAKNYFDVLSQHYYCDPPGHNYCNSDRSIIDPTTLANTWTKNIYPILQANGDGSKPVWVTETGYNTSPTGISQSLQATYITQSFQVAQTLPSVKRLYWYTSDDSDSGTNPENYYGIMINTSTGFTFKPAYNSLQQFIQSQPL